MRGNRAGRRWLIFAGAFAAGAIPFSSVALGQLAYYNAQGTSGTANSTSGPIGSTNFYPTSTDPNVTATAIYANAPFNNPAGDTLTGNGLIWSGDATLGSPYQSTDDSNIQFFREDVTESNGTYDSIAYTNANYGAYQPNGQPSTGPDYTFGPNSSNNAANFVVNLQQAEEYGAFAQFTVTPGAGYEMSISSITFDIAQGTGNHTTMRGFGLFSSLDDYTNMIAGDGLVQGQRSGSGLPPQWESFNSDGSVTIVTAVSTSNEGPSTTAAAATYLTSDQDLASNSLYQDVVDPVTFRFYLWTQTSGSSLSFNNISVNGTTAAVPEPATLSVVGLGSAACLIRRRRRE